MHTDFPCLNSILCPHKLSNGNTLAIFSCKKNCFPLILDQFELWVLCFNHVTVSISSHSLSSLLLLLGPFKLYFVRVAILGPVHLTLGASGLQFNCCLRNANQLNIELVGVSCSFEVGFVCLCVFCFVLCVLSSCPWTPSYFHEFFFLFHSGDVQIHLKSDLSGSRVI